MTLILMYSSIYYGSKIVWSFSKCDVHAVVESLVGVDQMVLKGLTSSCFLDYIKDTSSKERPARHVSSQERAAHIHTSVSVFASNQIATESILGFIHSKENALGTVLEIDSSIQKRMKLINHTQMEIGSRIQNTS